MCLATASFNCETFGKPCLRAMSSASFCCSRYQACAIGVEEFAILAGKILVDAGAASHICQIALHNFVIEYDGRSGISA